MSIEIKVPVLPESVNEATVATWYKKPGEFVKRDEHLVDVETDKVVLEVVAPADGVLEEIMRAPGATVSAEEVIGKFKETKADEIKDATEKEEKSAEKSRISMPGKETYSPAVRRLAAEEGLDVSQMQGSGRGGRVTTTDVLKARQGKSVTKVREEGEKTREIPKAEPIFESIEIAVGERIEKRVPMTRLRARIAERLVQAQHTAAILTTFNEINMQPVMELRKKYKEEFEKTHGVRLGLMSFFTLAVIEALKHFPIINASIEGNDIIYHGYYDIGIAISSSRGLVVPVLRNAHAMSMDEIERRIAQYAKKAEASQLTMEDMTGGTFTITNGGVFGSLMATPILNPPQSAILGMHKIEERPVVEQGQLVIRPQMYVALSYDHRIIDGSDSVRFLVMVKELLEEPARVALGI